MTSTDTSRRTGQLVPVDEQPTGTRFARTLADLGPLLVALLPLLALAALNFVLPVLAPALMASVHLPVEAYGWLGGAIGLGSVIFFLVSHALTPVLGPLGTLRWGLLLGLAGASLILTGHWPAILAGGTLIGFAYGTTTPTGSQILADFTPRSSWGTLFSLRQSGVPAGGVLAAAIAGATLVQGDWATPLLWVTAVVALTLFALALAPQRFNMSRPLQPFHAAKLLAPQNLTLPFRALAAIPRLPSLVIAGCGLAMGHGAVAQFFVIYLSSGLGMSIALAAALFAIMQTCAIVGRVLIGALADAHGASQTVLSILAPLSALSAVLLALFSPEWPFAIQVAVAVAMGLTVATWNGLFLAEIAQLVPPSEVSSATASSAVFTFLSYMITPPLVGMLATTVGWRTTFLIIAAAPLTAGLILAARQRRPGRDAQATQAAQATQTPQATQTSLLTSRPNPRAARPGPALLTPRMAGAFLAGIAVALGLQQATGAYTSTPPALSRLAAAAPATSPATLAAGLQADDTRADTRPTADLATLLAMESRSPLGRPAAGVMRTDALAFADRYLRGLDGTTANRPEAAFWLKHALSGVLKDPALPWALTQLGSISAAPESGAPNFKTASAAWQIAAALGDPVATCFLARMHEFGAGIDRDAETARRLYRMAQSAGGCPGLTQALERLQK